MSTTNGFGVLMKGNNLLADCIRKLIPKKVYTLRTLHQSMCQISLSPSHKVGFRTNLGYEGTGLMSMVFDKCGGYYLGEFVDLFKSILMVNNLLQTLEQANSSEKGKSS